MILLTIVFTFLPIIFSYSIILYLLSSEYDIVRLIVSKFEQKLANIDSKSVRVLIKFSILVFEINYKILTFLSFAFPLEQRGDRIESTKSDVNYENLPTEEPKKTEKRTEKTQSLECNDLPIEKREGAECSKTQSEAAKETRRLQEANDKLQKEVEELTWRLQAEKRIRSDLEEVKEEETAKLRNSLEDALAKIDETTALLIKERESVQKAIEEASAIVKETTPIHVKMEETKEYDERRIELLERTESTKTQSIDVHGPSMQMKDVHVEERSRNLLNENLQEHQDFLIRCIAEPLGFSKGRPVSACITYKCLRQWQSFEVEETNIFDRILQTIGKDIKTRDNNSCLAYWLSNASTLFSLLQRTLKANGETSDASVTLQQVEPKYPALQFKQQLTTYVENIYETTRDNLKKKLSPVLALCIQAPRISSATSHDLLTAHWQGIVDNIDSFLNDFISNNVPPILVRKIFQQVFSFINIQLFNSVLLRRECCSLSNGEYVKGGLSELEQWCYKATEKYAGSALDELKHIRQATGFLVIRQKQNKTLDEICHDLCPALSIQQLYRISTTNWDDKYDSLSPDVISSMRVLMTEDCPFLLDDDSSKPFSADDLSKSMDQINIADIEPPPLIRDNPGFSFLLPRAES